MKREKMWGNLGALLIILVGAGFASSLTDELGNMDYLNLIWGITFILVGLVYLNWFLWKKD